MNNEKHFIQAAALAGILTASSLSASAQLLKGNLRADSVESMQIAYAFDGNMLNMNYQEVHPDSAGNFTFDMKMPATECDADIYVDNAIFGIHLEQGKTATIHIKQKGKKMEATFGGDNADLSRFRNTYSQAFDIMKYFSPDPAESKGYDGYRKLLETEYARLKKELPSIADEKKRADYARLSEGMYQWTILRLLMDKAYDEGKNVRGYPEYNDILSSVDPNDPMNIPCNLLFAWIDSKPTNETTHSIESMDTVEQYITHPAVRLCLTRYIAHSYFSYRSGDGKMAEFWARFQTFAKNYPDLIAAYAPKVEAAMKTKQGQAVPYAPTLTRPDGSTCCLSELYGKFLYIDVWATWCGPCCKEIPYLEKVAARFQGNENVTILSISVDQNRNAWLKKLENDKPAWPQYLLTPEEEKAFMTAWGIQGIPRFIMIDKKGNIYNADAIRPSDENIIQTIENAMNE